ncbi:MAG: GerMN domain-containing protein [Syntrophomonadaceae bacterium]|nr:GerMN domain-containing protein [Syntrophomonadaceae bacterium]MDD3889822.1 GerMN domain-containing protein [Syntrophomonadaceae bacterium]MDD4549796.1 GerMN domain-containing protein [Syntrophomonadaceae bacterium]
MAKKFISILAIVVLAICLISGGCSPDTDKDLESWKELLRMDREIKEPDKSDSVADKVLTDKPDTIKESVDIKLYFAGPNGGSLVMEKRTVEKVEGIARKTIEELIAGPQTPENLAVVPEGTRLLDINVKPDGLCIVNLSSEARKLDNEHQEKIMIYSVVNTLGQFPTVQNVSFMVDGEPVDQIAGYVDVSAPVRPDYNL